MYKRTNTISEFKLESNSISSNDQHGEKDNMQLDKKEKENLEEVIADMFENNNFIDLVHNYGKKYDPIISTSKKAIVILGQNKEDAYVISDFFKKGGRASVLQFRVNSL